MSISNKELAELSKNISRALNPLEKPLNSQQTRAIILQTHRTREARTLWEIAGRQMLTINRFTAWKFCSLLHKVLRDGHLQTIRDSQQEVPKLNAFGSYWARQSDPMGLCIAQYCNFLIRRLKFHDFYTMFNGNLQPVADAQAPDLNMCLNLCADVFDLLDCLLQLQDSVFASVAALGQSHTSSAQSKCRLGALTTVADDCAALYQISVWVMYGLCAALSAYDVSGFRQRFDVIFGKLQSFFWRLQAVKCISDMLSEMPELPTLAPSFNIREEFLPMPSAPLESDLDLHNW